jgi:hypothetical protein
MSSAKPPVVIFPQKTGLVLKTGQIYTTTGLALPKVFHFLAGRFIVH